MLTHIRWFLTHMVHLRQRFWIQCCCTNIFRRKWKLAKSYLWLWILLLVYALVNSILTFNTIWIHQRHLNRHIFSLCLSFRCLSSILKPLIINLGLDFLQFATHFTWRLIVDINLLHSIDILFYFVKIFTLELFIFI